MIRLIAHRGASYGAPENTTRAFLRALLDEAADGVECDIQLLKDGTPIVFHDGDTRALCGGGGLVARMSLEEFRALRLHGEPLSTLDEVVAALATVGRAFIWNIELKPTSRPRELVAATLAALAPIAGIPDITILISSFDPRTLMDLQARGWPHPIALLFEDPRSLFALALLDRTRLDIHPRNDRVDATSAAAWHAAGHRIRVWTVDDAAEARRLMALGVDALITNRPGPLRAELAAFAGSPANALTGEAGPSRSTIAGSPATALTGETGPSRSTIAGSPANALTGEAGPSRSTLTP